MTSVIKSENYRLGRSKEIWGMLLALIGMQAGLVVINFILTHVSFFKDLIAESGMDMGPMPGFFDGFANVVTGSGFQILFLIMVCSLVIKLYHSGVTKQLVSCGIRRNNVILGQFISFTSVFTGIAFVTGIAEGLKNVLIGGSFALGGINIGRFGLSLIGMVLVVASFVALYLLIAHLTGSMGAGIAIGLVFQMGAPGAVMGLSVFMKCDWIREYFLTTLQNGALNVTAPLNTQLLSIAGVAVYTAVLLVLCNIVFKHKEMK